MRTTIRRGFALVFSVIGLCGLLGGVSGCATSAAVRTTKYVEYIPAKPILNDEIFAFANVDPQLAEKAGQGQLVAFLGLQHTYFLKTGGDEILRLAQTPELETKKLQLMPSNGRGELFLEKQMVWGTVRFEYDTRSTGSNVSERQALNKLGFVAQKQDQQETGLFRKAIRVSGFTNPAITLSAEQSQRLTTNRYPFTLYQPNERKEHFNPIGLLLVPAGVVVDVLLSPLYLGGLLVVGLSLSHH